MFFSKQSDNWVGYIMNYQSFSFLLLSRKFTSIFVGISFIINIFPAFAEVKPQAPKPANRTTKAPSSGIVFKPRDRKPASENSRAGGSRGCAISNGIPITQLAPQAFIGKTASTRPMLAWYMSSSQTVEFRLFELKSGATPKQIGEPTEISGTVGINKLKLPLDYPELTVGKTYLWQIAINCENDVNVNRAEFTVINPQSLPKKQSTSIEESVNYYTENELWYEAFEESLKVANNGKLSSIASKLIQELAQSEISMKSEADIGNVKNRTEYLQKISAI